MKKLLSIAATALVALGAGSSCVLPNATTAYACELQNCTQTSFHTHSVCPLNDCIQSLNHEHDGVIYFANYGNGGHDHGNNTEPTATLQAAPKPYDCGVSGCDNSEGHSHTRCAVSGCNQMTNHQHDGIIYYGHDSGDGHAYHNCGVPGCAQDSQHTHNSCGVSGCNDRGAHSHESNNGTHGSGKSEHGGRHH